MEQIHFKDFNFAFEQLEKSYIIEYLEFDHTGHCYLKFNNCVTVSSIKSDGAERFKEIQFFDPITKQFYNDFAFRKEKSFDYGTLEKFSSFLVITLYFKTDYKYVATFKKI